MILQEGLQLEVSYTQQTNEAIRKGASQCEVKIDWSSKAPKRCVENSRLWPYHIGTSSVILAFWIYKAFKMDP